MPIKSNYISKKYLYRKTKNLTVRPFEATDFEAWKNAYLTMLKPSNTWDLGGKPKEQLTKAKFKKTLSFQAKLRKADTYYHLPVFNSEGLLIGMVSLMEVSRAISQTAFLGYRIFNNHWGKGYGKEAVEAAIDIGFKDIKLHRIEAGVEPANKRSIRLAKSLKMRKEGLKKRALFLRNKWVDLLMFTLTTEDVGLKFKTSHLQKIG